MSGLNLISRILILFLFSVIAFAGYEVKSDTVNTANALTGGAVRLTWRSIPSAGDILAPLLNSYVVYDVYRATTDIFSGHDISWVTQNVQALTLNVFVSNGTTTINYLDQVLLQDNVRYYYKILAYDTYLVSFGVVSYNVVSAVCTSLKDQSNRDGVSCSVMIPVAEYPEGTSIRLDVMSVPSFNTLYSAPSDNTLIAAFSIVMMGFDSPTFSSTASVLIDFPLSSTTSALNVYYWDQTTATWSSAGITSVSINAHQFSFSTTHLATFALFTTVDLIPPKISTMLIDEQSISTGDYVSARPELKVWFNESTAGSGLISCSLQLFKLDSGGATLVTSSTKVYPAIKGQIRFMYRPEDPLQEGTYYYRTTLTDANGNFQVFTSPLFNIRSSSFTLNAIHGPNPFSPNADGLNDLLKITYQISFDADVSIKIFNISGKLIHKWDFIAGDPSGGISGYNEVLWNGRNLDGTIVANGVYIAYITASSQFGKSRDILKIAVLK